MLIGDRGTQKAGETPRELPVRTRLTRRCYPSKSTLFVDSEVWAISSIHKSRQTTDKQRPKGSLEMLIDPHSSQ